MESHLQIPRIVTQTIREFPFPDFITADKINIGLNFKPRDDDIVVVTYPKCGTFWTQYIVWSLQNFGMSPLPAPNQLNDIAPWIEEDLTIAEFLQSPRQLKSHLPFKLIPYNPMTKYIYIARNPRDCAVSYYNFFRSGVGNEIFANASFDDFFEQFITGDLPFGDFYDHVISWHKHKDDENVLFIFYENMIEDPYDGVLKIAQFISDEKINYEYEITKNDNELLKRIVENTSFINMKKMPFFIEREKEGRIATKEVPLFRKGIVGDWNRHFNSKQIERLNERERIKLSSAGIENLWKY